MKRISFARPLWFAGFVFRCRARTNAAKDGYGGEGDEKKGNDGLHGYWVIPALQAKGFFLVFRAMRAEICAKLVMRALGYAVAVRVG